MNQHNPVSLTMPSYKISVIFIFTLAGLLFGSNALSADVAGTVGKLTGTAEAQTLDGASREVSQGDEIAVGETIKTGSRSHISLKFADKSRFDLGPNTEMLVESFRGGKKVRPEKSSFISRINKGSFRFVSGLIAKSNSGAMRVKSPVLTIGIRGTHVVGKVDETSGTVILAEPEGEPHPTAIDVSNQYGSVTIDEPGYGTEVPDAQSPPSPPRRMKEQVIRNMMNSIRAVQRINVPRPRVGH